MSQNPWYRIAIVAVLAMAVVFVLAGKKPASETPAVEAGSAATQPPAADPTVPTKSEEANRKLPRLVDLGAGKCIPCKMMAPILEELKKEQAGTIAVEFIDVWKDPKAGQQYGINVIPTQIFYDAEGKEFFRHEGFFAKDEILAQFKKQGIEPAPAKAVG